MIIISCRMEFSMKVKKEFEMLDVFHNKNTRRSEFIRHGAEALP